MGLSLLLPPNAPRGLGPPGDSGSQAREDKAGPEVRPSLTVSQAATQLKDQGSRGPNPSARPTGPDAKLVVLRAEKCSELISGSGPAELGPSPNTRHNIIINFGIEYRCQTLLDKGQFRLEQ